MRERERERVCVCVCVRVSLSRVTELHLSRGVWVEISQICVCSDPELAAAWRRCLLTLDFVPEAFLSF